MLDGLALFCKRDLGRVPPTLLQSFDIDAAGALIETWQSVLE